MKFMTCLLLLFLLQGNIGYSQIDPLTNKITGKVTDDREQPLKDAAVIVKGTNNGVKSDTGGNFIIDASSKSILVITYVGFETLELVVNNQSNISIQMKTSNSKVDHVVVVESGKTSRRSLTTATSKVSAKDIGMQLASGEIQKMAYKVADWQLANPNNTSMSDWVQGPFINGLMAIGKMPGDSKYLKAVMQIGEKEQWGVINAGWRANDHCTPQTWMEMFEVRNQPKMIKAIRNELDRNMGRCCYAG